MFWKLDLLLSSDIKWERILFRWGNYTELVSELFLDLHWNTDFSVSNIENFQVTAIAVRSSLQIVQSIRIVMVGNIICPSL
jgi:hypothetical protein